MDWIGTELLPPYGTDYLELNCFFSPPIYLPVKRIVAKKFPMLKKICSLSPISFCPGLWVPLADQGETSMVPNCRTQVINRSTQLICIFDFYLSTYKCKIHSIVPSCRAQVDSRFSLHSYLIFVLFSPQAQFLNKFFSTQKCVNRDKIDFAPIQRKWQQSRFRDKSA